MCICLYACFYVQAASVVRLIPFFQRLSESRKKFPLQVIYASAIDVMGLSVFADGQSLHKAFLKINSVVIQNCFQAVFQKEQIALELPEILF